MLKLLLATIRINTDYTKYSFLVMTTDDFRDEIVAVGKSVGIDLQIHIIEPPTMFLESQRKRELFSEPSFEPYAFHSSASKCRIFEVPGIEAYTHILYLDTDILIKDDFKNMLTSLPADDKLYAVEDGRLGHPSSGGTFITPDICSNPWGTPAINAGVFFFRNTPKIRRVMTDCLQFMNDRIQREEPMPRCLEQPFVNFFFYKNDCMDSQFMKHYISLGESGAMSPSKSISIIHFFAPIGDGQGKFKRMKGFISTMTEVVENQFKNVQNERAIGKVFEWTSSDYHITFQNDGSLTSTWHSGRYHWINQDTIIADFGNARHLIRFDSEYNTFLSLRKSDGDIVCGRRQV
jgi:hemolysin-activating ACP:hemolysin acyltransferase